MDHHIQLPLLVPVHLDEVVAAPQRADALFRPEHLNVPEAAQLLQVDLVRVPVDGGAHRKAGGDFLPDQLIQLLQLQMVLPEPGRLHAAADIHPHQVGDHPVGDGHGGAHGAPRPCVDVGHQPDAAAGSKLLIAQLNHLGDGRLVHHVGKNLCLIVLS